MKCLPIDRGLAKRIIAGATLISFVATPPYAMAALTDISNSPISSAAAPTVPPNVLFILDASGSMGREYMPDEASSYSGDVGGKSHLCNTIYYNPATTYPVPKNADGSDFPSANFLSASSDGFLGGSSSNLSSNFEPNGSSSSEPAYYYRRNSLPAPAAWDTLTPIQKDAQCSISDSSSFPHVTGNWEKVRIAAGERQNFANWYTYYRTRMLLMKSAAGRAFNALTDTFRVGFITICPNGGSCNNDDAVTPVLPAFYLKIDAFTPTHKLAWYNKFYQQSPASFTPLRQALARAGRHFAGRMDGINSGMSPDPIQYSCQQNFAILTTDGYWNYGKGKTITNGTSGTGDIGQQDNDIGLTPRPMFDSGPVNLVQTRYQQGSSIPSCPSSQEGRIRQRTTTQSGTQSFTNVGSTVCVPVGTCIAADDTDTLCPWSSGTTTATVGTANTLADVAEYYYRTDLRGPGSLGALGTDVGTLNNVPPSGTGVEDDKATHQHMTTFTLGMGLDGQLKFDPNYQNQTTGDFADIRSGVKGWPNPNPSDPGGSGTADQQARIDDLWHAAVNGRGQYFSAKDPTSLALSLTTALTSIQARLASAAAAATSTLEPTATDNLVVVPTYVTNEWTGELKAFQIDLTTGSPTYGQVLPAVVWSAQTKLDAKAKAACDTRTIKLFRAGATDNLVDFTWNSQTCDGSGNPTGAPSTGLNATEQEFFTAAGAADEPAALSHWGLMTDGTSMTANQKGAAPGANLVNFLRGQRGKEGFAPNDINKLYRSRARVLGDIVNSQPIYVRNAPFNYADTTGPGGYAAFKSSVASRAPMVYVSANDGMLHAFTATADSTGGEEAWAFIPRAVLPRLFKLADNNYANLHEYYVDGKPVTGDVFDGSTWRTILVGGLNKGGRGYYALDVTDPASPKALWEFTSATDSDLGYSFGNPVISKLADGRWVVFVTSGYNNVTPGSGQGYLYVLEAATGTVLYKIGTGVGDTTTPSGLAKITAWVNNTDQNNTTLRVYGVDLLGNVWRFDVNDTLAPAGREATRLATVKDPLGIPQPITIAPRLAEVGNPPAPFVYVGTGRYFGASDVGNTQVQGVYAIKDPLTATPYADLRASLKKLTLTTVGTERFVSCDTASVTSNCGSTDGWFVDLTEPGERVNVAMELQLGTLVVASNVPANTACEPGGFSFLNYFDFTTGFSPAGTLSAIGYRTSGLTVGISIVRLPDGTVVAYRQRGDPPPDGTPEKEKIPITAGAPSGKRITWRELMP